MFKKNNMDLIPILRGSVNLKVITFNIHSTPSFMLNGHFLPKGFNFMDIINF